MIKSKKRLTGTEESLEESTERRIERHFYGEVAETAEGARLLSGYTGNTVSRVRIPPSPPLEFNPLETVGFSFWCELYSCGYI